MNPVRVTGTEPAAAVVQLAPSGDRGLGLSAPAPELPLCSDGAHIPELCGEGQRPAVQQRAVGQQDLRILHMVCREFRRDCAVPSPWIVTSFTAL